MSYDFFVHYNIVGTINIINIHKYLMKNHANWCLGLLKKCLLSY